MTEDQKKLNKQIQAGIAEKARLQEVVNDLNETLKERTLEVDLELVELDKTLATKKREVTSVKEAADSKNDEVTKIQDQLTNLKENISKAEVQLGVCIGQKQNVLTEVEEARVILKKARKTITLEKNEAISDVKTELNVIAGRTSSTKEKLSVLVRQVSKIEFVKKVADEALSEVSKRNSELEKIEKETRNKVVSYKSIIKDLEMKEYNLLTQIKKYAKTVESDKARAGMAEEKRRDAEEKLEIVNTEILQNKKRSDQKEEQLNARAEKLKRAYDESGIKWPNL